jgi:hypothetical protein
MFIACFKVLFCKVLKIKVYCFRNGWNEFAVYLFLACLGRFFYVFF